MTRLPLLMVALFALAACDPATTAAFAGANLVAFIHTDKTAADHAASWAMKEDCSILQAAHNEPYCQPPQPADERRDSVAALGASLYCYRTLGGVSCYDRPDYMASGQTRVEFAHGYLAPQPPLAAAPVAALPDSAVY